MLECGQYYDLRGYDISQVYEKTQEEWDTIEHLSSKAALTPAQEAELLRQPDTMFAVRADPEKDWSVDEWKKYGLIAKGTGHMRSTKTTSLLRESEPG